MYLCVWADCGVRVVCVYTTCVQVWEEMNLAWSSHEIISDFATPAFVWFEGG